nr:unnamed protein product [Callosobruchus analis]
MFLLAAANACFVLIATKKKKKKRWWVQSLYKSRNIYNVRNMLVDMLKEPSGKFDNFCRMSYEDFEILLNKVLNIRKERLAVTLRFLASGDSYQSLSYLFKISPQIISTIIPEVCDALIVALSEHLKTPESSFEWREIAKEFEVRWNFPHCCGALDGKHVLLQAPLKSGSEYFNYKSSFSVVLMALCDANYCITYVNIGSPGRMSDGGIFQNCKLSEYMENGNINFPPDNVLPSTQKKQPHVIVADNAFPLKNNLMVPYPGLHDKGSEKRIFNYRLSRARRLIENVFGIMAAVFRILRMPMMLCPDKANKIIKTCVLLHNFLRRSATSRTSYSPQGTFDDEQNGKFIPGSWRSDNEGLVSLKPLHSVPRRSRLEAETVRQAFSHYFLNTGKVSWQNEY